MNSIHWDELHSGPFHGGFTINEGKFDHHGTLIGLSCPRCSRVQQAPCVVDIVISLSSIARIDKSIDSLAAFMLGYLSIRELQQTELDALPILSAHHTEGSIDSETIQFACGALHCQKELFALENESIVYLNGAARSPMPRSVAATGRSAVDTKLFPWRMENEHIVVGEVCALYSNLINAESPDCIAITPSTSYAMALAAKNIPFNSGQTVLCLEGQMASNVLPWQHLCTEYGTAITVVRRPLDGDWTNAVIRRIAEVGKEAVGVVAIPACHWCDGSLVDLKIIGHFCLKVGFFIASHPVDMM